MLDQIKKLLVPPESRRGLDRTWEEVEKELQLTLPDDYKSFIKSYGTGQITSSGGWVNVFNFRDRSIFDSPLMDALGGDRSIAGSYRRLEATSFPCPFPIFPQPGGLLPVATVNDVSILNWFTKEGHDKWDVVYYFSDGCEFNHLVKDSFLMSILKMLKKEYSGLSQPSSLQPPFEFTDFKIC